MDKTITIAITVLVLIIIAGIAVVFSGIPVQQDTLLKTGGGAPTDTIYFFYGTECPHCHDVMPFIENMTQKYPEANIQVLEVWHNETNERLYIQANAAAGVTAYGVPEVVVGKTALIGANEIPAKFEGLIQNYLDKKRLNNPPKETISGVVKSSNVRVVIPAVYFYGDGCVHCAKVEPFIERLEEKYPELRLEKLEIYNNVTNQQRFVSLNQQHNIMTNDAGIPEIFIGNTVLMGEIQIPESFETRILAEKARSESSGPSSLTPGSSPSQLPALTPQMVIVPALVDSLNPCALSVLIFLLISIAAAANRRRILLIGGSYIAAVFLFHLLVGIGIFSVVSFSGISKIFSLAGAAVALLLGLVTLADVARNRDNFILSVPTSGKGLMARYIRLASLPAAFILGILAGLLGFSCTGGIYISILALMGTSMSLTAGLSYLFLYNIVFVLPLVLVTLLVAYGLSPERADTWRNEHKRALRLAIGLIMVALGIVIFLGWFG